MGEDINWHRWEVIPRKTNGSCVNTCHESNLISSNSRPIKGSCGWEGRREWNRKWWWWRLFWR